MLEPFEIAVPDTVLEDLASRLKATRLPPEMTEAGWADGTNPSYLRELVTYWRDHFDWRKQERLFNGFRHFHTTL